MTKPSNVPSGDVPTRRTFLRIAAVCEATGLSRSTLYERVAAGTFPKQFRISPRCTAWDEAEVLAWQAQRIAERDQAAA